MKRAAVLIAALCAGCSHSQVYVNSSTGSASSGTQGSVQVHARSGSDFFTLLGLTLVAAAGIVLMFGRPAPARTGLAQASR